MPATFGGQITLLIGVFTLIGIGIKTLKVYNAHREEELQHQEWLELCIINYAKQTGFPLPKWLLDKHILINGNSKLTAEETDDRYGPRSTDE